MIYQLNLLFAVGLITLEKKMQQNLLKRHTKLPNDFKKMIVKYILSKNKKKLARTFKSQE